MSFCHSINDNTNFCKVWSVIKSMSGSRTWSLIRTIKCNNQIHTKGKDIANAFARKFASTSSNTNYEEQFIRKRAEQERVLLDLAFTAETTDDKLSSPFVESELENVLSKPRKYTSPGPDKLCY